MSSINFFTWFSNYKNQFYLNKNLAKFHYRWENELNEAINFLKFFKFYNFYFKIHPYNPHKSLQLEIREINKANLLQEQPLLFNVFWTGSRFLDQTQRVILILQSL